MTNEEIFGALNEPFDPRDVQWSDPEKTKKPSSPSIRAHVLMDRFDAVLGPQNWWPEKPVMVDGGILYGITVRLPDGSTVTKWDGSGTAQMVLKTKNGEYLPDVKSILKATLSDCFKRTAAMWGPGRYLWTHRPGDLIELPKGWAHTADGPIRHDTPASQKATVPTAAPGVKQPAVAKALPPEPSPPAAVGRNPNLPVTAHDFYHWCADHRKAGRDVVSEVQAWANDQNRGGCKPPYPVRFLNWTEDQVEMGVVVALQFLDELQAQPPAPRPSCNGSSRSAVAGMFPAKATR